MATQTTPRKRCSKCLKIKPLTDFWKQADHADGHASSCKACGLRQKQENDTPERLQARRNWHAAWKRAVYRLISGHKREFQKLMKEEREK